MTDWYHTSVTRHGQAHEEVDLLVHDHVDLRSIDVVIGRVQTSHLANIASDGGALRDHRIVIDAQGWHLSKSQLAADLELMELICMHPKVLKRHSTIRANETDGFTLARNVEVV
mgnify:CR=1 FL=1